MVPTWKVALGIVGSLVAGASIGYLVGKESGHLEMYQAVKHSLEEGERHLGELMMNRTEDVAPRFEHSAVLYVNQHWMRSSPDDVLMRYLQRRE